jgi:hypothetical protein
LDHTLEVEPKRAIRPKGKLTVVEHAIANSTQDRQGTRHRYPGDVAQPRRRSDRIEMLFAAVHKSLVGTFRTSRHVRSSIAIGEKADVERTPVLVAIDPERTFAVLKALLSNPVCSPIKESV